MNPQDNQQPPQQSFEQPAPAPAPTIDLTMHQSSTRMGKRVLIVVSILILLVAGYGVYFFYDKNKTSEERLQATQKELYETQELASDLAKTDTKIELQKKLNDDQRRNDLAFFVTVLKDYAANNNGVFPSTEPSSFKNDFADRYLFNVVDDFNDPTTLVQYELIPVANVQTPPGVTLGSIQYQWPGKCLGTEFSDEASTREAAARMILESGEIYCLDA